MSNTTERPPGRDTGGPESAPSPKELGRLLQAHFHAAQLVRRGVCLLNAGQYDDAESFFHQAGDLGSHCRPLPTYLAACFVGKTTPSKAVAALETVTREEPHQTAARIRYAYALWQAGRRDDAIGCLRDGIRENTESGELHFQLGTLLAAMEQYDEAELRFTQTLSIDRDHSEALVSLAMCRGLRNAPAESVNYLRRAQARRPFDARIGVLLAQAARGAQQKGQSVRVRAEMPILEPVADKQGIEELSRVIESDPDFVDAFLTIPLGEVDEQVFGMLLATLEVALERQPEHAELNHHCGRVLDRLGRREDAIQRNERAVEINPKFTRALIELGKLYHATDRQANATNRLEQAVAAGADYADVHYLLGELYRDQGQVTRARSAFRRAIAINQHYRAAQEALESLAVEVAE